MIYLDHAATTPLRPEAQAAMVEQLSSTGNASSLHGAGRDARRIVEESREAIAAAVGARSGQVIFTAGGTEADNLAVKGIHWSRRRPVVAVSSIEHHAVLDPAHWLAAHEGADLRELPVDAHARLDLSALDALLSEGPDQISLISVMWANNEVGTLQPIADVVERAAEFGVPVHSDAVQAVGHVPIDFAASGLAALTLSAHKFGGPLGVGALIAQRELGLTPVLHGGGQERDVRSGTLNAPAIAGMAVALTASVASLGVEALRISRLRDELVAGIRSVVPDAVFDGDPVERLPGNAHLRFPGCEGDALLMLLDSAGIACSAGSACSAGVPRASHVVLAMGVEERDARSALRFSLGRTTTRDEVGSVVAAIGPIVERARRAGQR